MPDSPPMLSARATYIGGPTVLLEVGGFRLLTDPTFDPAGTEYPTAVYTLRRLPTSVSLSCSAARHSLGARE